MKYVILMTSPAGAWESLPAEEQERIVKQHEAFMGELQARGSYVGSLRLQPGEAARTLRRDAAGELSEQDGPCCEEVGQIGGLYVIEADSMEQAASWGRRARFMVGANEVRPVWSS